MSDKYCPAGKCECEKFSRSDKYKFNYCGNVRFPELVEVCFRPSRQQIVEPQKQNEEIVNAYDYSLGWVEGYGTGQADGRAAGRAEGLRVAVAEMEKLADSHPDINVNVENGWVKLSVVIAAIKAQEGK